MLDIESGYYFGLNSVASAIWNHLEHPVAWDTLIDLLMQTFEVSRDVCEADTKELIDLMLNKGIIREIS